jgi:hypothetical protein
MLHSTMFLTWKWISQRDNIVEYYVVIIWLLES